MCMCCIQLFPELQNQSRKSGGSGESLLFLEVLRLSHIQCTFLTKLFHYFCHDFVTVLINGMFSLLNLQQKAKREEKTKTLKTGDAFKSYLRSFCDRRQQKQTWQMVYRYIHRYGRREADLFLHLTIYIDRDSDQKTRRGPRIWTRRYPYYFHYDLKTSKLKCKYTILYYYQYISVVMQSI